MPNNPLPSPPVPADLDLTDSPGFHLSEEVLLDGGLSSITDSESFRMTFLSWCIAWHQVPAGSLPDDDALLAKLFGYGWALDSAALWKEARRRGVLLGWSQASDGRLYHPTVTSWVLAEATRRQKNKDRTKPARVARYGEDHLTAIADGQRERKSLRDDLQGEAWRALRIEVFERDGWRCTYCGAESNDLACDHKVPVIKGGLTTLDNLTTSCRPCNARKGARVFEGAI